MMGETFHFLRPEWLWGLLGLPLLLMIMRMVFMKQVNIERKVVLMVYQQIKLLVKQT